MTPSISFSVIAIISGEETIVKLIFSVGLKTPDNTSICAFKALSVATGESVYWNNFIVAENQNFTRSISRIAYPQTALIAQDSEAIT